MEISRRFMATITVLTGVLFMTTFLLGFQAEAQHTKSSLKKRNRAAAVTVEVIYLNPIEKIEKGKLVFEVAMNTHSVDLDQYAMEQISLLRDDKGMEMKAIAWDGPAGGGHHRSGKLIFSDGDRSGKPLISPETKFIELIIKGIGGEKERVFRWDLPLN